MAEEKIGFYYRGPDGALNFDVAREAGGGPAMRHGERYEVSEELAVRLLPTTDWEVVKNAAGRRLKKEARVFADGDAEPDARPETPDEPPDEPSDEGPEQTEPPGDADEDDEDEGGSE